MSSATTSETPVRRAPGNPQSLNRYAYVANNPTTFTDPLGLQPDSFDGGDCSDPSFADSNADPLLSGDFGRLAFLSPWEIWGPFGPSVPCDFGTCTSIDNPFTGQVGGSFNLTLPWWGISVTYFAGIAIDLHGHVGFYHGYGGGLGAGAGASGGVQVGFSNADTICGLAGPFANGSGTLGVEGATGTVDVFQGNGNGPGGVVTGGTVTWGLGGGASASVGGTTTTVVPTGNYSCKP